MTASARYRCRDAEVLCMLAHACGARAVARRCCRNNQIVLAYGNLFACVGQNLFACSWAKACCPKTRAVSLPWKFICVDCCRGMRLPATLAVVLDRGHSLPAVLLSYAGAFVNYAVQAGLSEGCQSCSGSVLYLEAGALCFAMRRIYLARAHPGYPAA